MSIEEITKEIEDLDPEDIGLKQIMGNRFQDTTKKPMVEPFARETVTCDYTDIPKPEMKTKKPNTKLMKCAKWSSLFIALGLLFFYWQHSGQMAPSASIPSMLACAAMVGWSFGKYASKGDA